MVRLQNLDNPALIHQPSGLCFQLLRVDVHRFPSTYCLHLALPDPHSCTDLGSDRRTPHRKLPSPRGKRRGPIRKSNINNLSVKSTHRILRITPNSGNAEPKRIDYMVYPLRRSNLNLQILSRDHKESQALTNKRMFSQKSEACSAS